MARMLSFINSLVLAVGLLLSSAVSAQTYSKTEVITYSDNTTKWVLGQTSSVTCTVSVPASTACDGDVVSATTYDPTYALPLTTSSFGKLQSTMTYDTTSTVASGQLGTLKTVKDGLNQATTFSNWKRGIPQNIAYADSTTQSAVVDNNGWIGSVTDELGSTTSYGYDSMGRLASIAYPTGDTVAWTGTTRSFVPVASVEYGIAAGHWRETVTTGNATKITYYDGMWRPLLVREYDAGNQAATERFTKTAYDAEGRVSFAAYPMSNVTYAAQQAGDKGVTTFYDALGRVTSVSQDSELGLLTTTTEYLTGFQTKVTSPRGATTAVTTSYLTYDQPSTDWPLTIAAPESATTMIGRDPHGKLLSLVRSGGGASATRSYGYNAYQELCRSEEPETGTTVFGYDAAGNLSWSAAGLASGQACSSTGTEAAIVARKASRTYDVRNRLKTLVFPDGNGNQTWNYFNDGLPSAVSTSNGGNTVSNSYTYNKRRLLTGESMVPDATYLGWAIGYGYNGLGQVVSEALPASVSATYTVNALGQTTQVSVGVPSLSTNTIIASAASYFPNGALKQFTYGNGIVHTMTQNARQLPSQSMDCTLAGACAQANRRLNLAYAYDANGNVAGITDGTSTGQQTRSMVYDGLDRLTQVTSPATAFGTASYVYDALDNLKQVTVSGGTTPRTHFYCYNATSNRLDFVRSGAVCTGSASPAVTALTYDVQGNLASKNGAVYGFDYGNRLRSTAGLTYRYDADGRRVRLDTAGAQAKYSYYAKDGRLVWQRDDVAGKRLHNLYLAGSLIAEFSRPVSGATETITYFHTDALGSLIAKTDVAKATIESTSFEPYGLMNRPNDDRVGYTGHVMDRASGLTYMQQRYYDPQIGRFLSVDPVTAYSNPVGAFNRYWYANNNPYTFNDPDGRWSAKAHDKLIANALGKRISASDVKAIQQSSRDFDKRTQGDDQSHMHSMAREGQSSDDAKSMRRNFIGTTMVEARNAADSGDRATALKLFGEAMHPVMDSSSPEHTDSNGNPAVWRGMEDAWGHSPTDWIGNETSSDLTPEILGSQSSRINSAYDWVFREEKKPEADK